MGVIQYIFGALILILALILIFAILMQEGRRAGINGAISGGADTFLAKNKARSVDAFLGRWTKVAAIAFGVLVLAVNIIAIVQNAAS